MSWHLILFLSEIGCLWTEQKTDVFIGHRLARRGTNLGTKIVWVGTKFKISLSSTQSLGFPCLDRLPFPAKHCCWASCAAHSSGLHQGGTCWFANWHPVFLFCQQPQSWSFTETECIHLSSYFYSDNCRFKSFTSERCWWKYWSAWGPCAAAYHTTIPISIPGN